MQIYFDTSALVKEFVNEEGSDTIKQFVKTAISEESSNFLTAAVTQAESEAAFAAMRRNRELTQPKYEEVLQRFEKRWRVFSIVEVSSLLIDISGSIARNHKIKGCDAFQVASALVGQANLVVSTDRDLNQAAKNEGLQVWNPMLETIPQIFGSVDEE